jgi:hypothetical protein
MYPFCPAFSSPCTSLIQTTNFCYIMTFAFNYPNSVGNNFRQQREELSIVTMLLTGDRRIVFRFPVETKIFLVSKVSRKAVVRNQLAI